ncbi:MAG: peroxiredoxin [Cognaticolwellia sp.]|jgi:peroxiredoxin
MALQVGDKAPNFTLTSDSKSPISLKDFQGKNTVVLFFPLAFTGVCTTELCTIRDDISAYQNLDAEVLAISVDSPFVLEEFKKQQNLNFPLLSDFNATTSAEYGALYDDFVLGMKKVSKRSAFVMDKEGTIRYAEVLDSAGDLPNFGAIKEILSGL